MLKDEIGNRYSRLVVIARDCNTADGSAQWKCRCDCGNEITTKGVSLRNGRCRSCGCWYLDYLNRNGDLSGQHFGEWTVIRRDEAKHGTRYWICRCNCGTIRAVAASSLRHSVSTSCGCRSKDWLRTGLNKGDSGFKVFVASCRANARSRNLPWELTDTEVRAIASLPCAYCGQQPSQIHGQSDYALYVHGGLDRLDNSRGYTSDNVLPCCKICNRAKNDLQIADFSAWIKRVYEYFVSPTQSHRKVVRCG